MSGQADRKIETHFTTGGFKFVGNVGASGSNAPGGNQYIASFIPGTYTFLPTSAAVDSWETWELYSNTSQSGEAVAPGHL